MAAVLEDQDVPLPTESIIVVARPSQVPYAPRQDLPRRYSDLAATILGCALAMGALFLLLR